ncbi:hypothetical protein CEXT_757011, partial [Caerostris extrusa]
NVALRKNDESAKDARRTNDELKFIYSENDVSKSSDLYLALPKAGADIARKRTKSDHVASGNSQGQSRDVEKPSACFVFRTSIEFRTNNRRKILN